MVLIYKFVINAPVSTGKRDLSFITARRVVSDFSTPSANLAKRVELPGHVKFGAVAPGVDFVAPAAKRAVPFTS